MFRKAPCFEMVLFFYTIKNKGDEIYGGNLVWWQHLHNERRK